MLIPTLLQGWGPWLPLQWQLHIVLAFLGAVPITLGQTYAGSVIQDLDDRLPFH